MEPHQRLFENLHVVDPLDLVYPLSLAIYGKLFTQDFVIEEIHQEKVILFWNCSPRDEVGESQHYGI